MSSDVDKSQDKEVAMSPRSDLPAIELIDETMREGMQIESVTIPVSTKVELIRQLSQTGLRTIVVGSFVSPRWVPQMADIDEILDQIDPVDGVTFSALALNQQGVERRESWRSLITPPSGPDLHRTKAHLCDVFVRRNTNRSQADEIASWPGIVQRAVDADADAAGIAVNAAWGSNWSGEFTQQERMDLLERQHALWDEAGIPVRKIWLGDPMGWNNPAQVSAQIEHLRAAWPDVTDYHLHLHNTRGLALASAYAAIDSLAGDHTLTLDTSVGGVGGCPYCGNGRATGMIPTEDMVEMLTGLGVSTGIDMARLLHVAELLESAVGRRLDGHVSRAGPCPRTEDERYDLDLPLIETFEDALHFRNTYRAKNY